MTAQHSPIITENAPAAIGPYSQAIRCGDLVFCSGQLPMDPQSGDLVGKTTAEQTEQALKNLRAVLEAAGSSLDRVLKTTVFLQDLADFAEFNQVYARFFDQVPPARSAVQVARLPRDVRVEVEAVARL
ncbi:MAG: RidA family protein [Candidatus Xenobium sp.]|jgi:2-iminobutanoate/2-iminopropanoate deaminase|nr:RidA family protein [Burkholderiales bacterium]